MRTSKPTTATVRFFQMTEVQQNELEKLMFLHIAGLVQQHFKEIENEQLRKYAVCSDLQNQHKHADGEIDPRPKDDRPRVCR